VSPVREWAGDATSNKQEKEMKTVWTLYDAEIGSEGIRVFASKQGLVQCLREEYSEHIGDSGEKFSASDTDDCVLEKAFGNGGGWFEGIWFDEQPLERLNTNRAAGRNRHQTKNQKTPRIVRKRFLMIGEVTRRYPAISAHPPRRTAVQIPKAMGAGKERKRHNGKYEKIRRVALLEVG
jgi:hypothetical protein